MAESEPAADITEQTPAQTSSGSAEEQGKRAGAGRSSTEGVEEGASAAAAAAMARDSNGSGRLEVPQKVGLLQKKGEKGNLFGGASWKERWFALRGGFMTYHATEELARERRKPIKDNFVPVRHFVVMCGVSDDRTVLLAPLSETGPSLRQWEMRASNTEERDAWIQAFIEHGATSEEELEKAKKKDRAKRRASAAGALQRRG